MIKYDAHGKKRWVDENGLYPQLIGVGIIDDSPVIGFWAQFSAVIGPQSLVVKMLF